MSSKDCKQDSENITVDVNPPKVIDFKTTPSAIPPKNLIPPESQIKTSSFLDLMLDSLKELNAQPSVSCEQFYPEKLRKKAYLPKKAFRQIRKTETIDIKEDKFISELKTKISNIPDFEKKYDYLLLKSKALNI